MKLPRQGCLFDPETGKVVWGFYNPVPDTEWDITAPRIVDMDGNVRFIAEPQHEILDLDGLPAEEVKMVLRDHESIRVRKRPEGKIEFTQLVDVDGAIEEIEHPVTTRRKLVAEVREKRGRDGDPKPPH